MDESGHEASGGGGKYGVDSTGGGGWEEGGRETESKAMRDNTESKTGTKKDEMTSKGGFEEDRLEIRESKRVRDR
jgi:hypothetical protein